MRLVQVDIIGGEAAQAGLAGRYQVVARQPKVVRSRPHRREGLGGDLHTLPPALQRRAEHFFGEPFRIDVGGVEQRDTLLDRNIDQVTGPFRIEGAHGRMPALASESHRS